MDSWRNIHTSIRITRLRHHSSNICRSEYIFLGESVREPRKKNVGFKLGSRKFPLVELIMFTRKGPITAFIECHTSQRQEINEQVIKLGWWRERWRRSTHECMRLWELDAMADH
jgi:hypothetical protein